MPNYRVAYHHSGVWWHFHNYTIIAIFEVNMMIWLPKEYNIYRAECKVNIVFRSEVNSVDRKKKTRAIIGFFFVMNQRQIDTGI